MKKYGWVLGLIGAALLSVSCVIPEEFTCDVAVAKDGTYSVQVKGTLVFYTVFEEIKQEGRVSAKTDSDIRSFFDRAVAKEPAVKKYEYRGNGRAYIEYGKEVKDGSSTDLSSSGLPLTITVYGNDSLVIAVPAIKSKDRESITDYTRYGYKLDGTITITSELPVIDAGGQKVHNKYLLFGPKVISRTVTINTLPAEDIVIVIGRQGQ
jgi:hypothetical protein